MIHRTPSAFVRCVYVPRVHTEAGLLSSTREVDFFGLRRLNATPWDLVAIVLVIGLVAFLARTSRELLEPLAHLEAVPLSLDPIHLPEYAARTTLRMLAALAVSLAVLVELRDLGREERARRQAARADPRRAPVGADPGLHLDHGRVLLDARARPRDRRRARRDLRDLHEPGLEHGVQRLPVLAHGAHRAPRGRGFVSPHAVDALLAARGAVRDARARLEHDDVDVGRLVLRRRGGGDHGRQHDVRAARRRLVYRARDRAPRPRGDRLGDRDDARRDPALRPALVPAARRVDGSLPRRAGPGPRSAALLGARGAAPLAARGRRAQRVRRAVSLVRAAAGRAGAARSRRAAARAARRLARARARARRARVRAAAHRRDADRGDVARRGARGRAASRCSR